MSWIDKLPKHVDDESGLELAVLDYNRKYVHVGSHDLFEKDCAGQWYVQSEDGLSERGPFNSLEHACECMYYVYEG